MFLFVKACWNIAVIHRKKLLKNFFRLSTVFIFAKIFFRDIMEAREQLKIFLFFCASNLVWKARGRKRGGIQKSTFSFLHDVHSFHRRLLAFFTTELPRTYECTPIYELRIEAITLFFGRAVRNNRNEMRKGQKARINGKRFPMLLNTLCNPPNCHTIRIGLAS